MRQRTTLTALQGLRGAAALLVVCDHAISNLAAKAGRTTPVELGWFFGHLGVATFFAISGFVMVYAHGRDFGDRTAWRRFAGRRIGRIVPIYWTVTLFYALKLALEGRGASIGDTLLSLLFVPYAATGGEYGRPVVGQGWTLNYEMVFYLVFGLCLVFKRGLALVAIVFGALVAAGASGWLGTGNPLAFWANPIVLYFLAGIAIGLLRARLTGGPDFGLALIAALLCLMAASLCAFAAGPQAPLTSTLGALAALCAVAACACADETAIGSVPRRIGKALGDASYSIYLTHTFVLGPAATAVGRLVPGLPTPVFVLIMLPATAAIGILVYRFVETPLIRGWAVLAGARGRPSVGLAAER